MLFLLIFALHIQIEEGICPPLNWQRIQRESRRQRPWFMLQGLSKCWQLPPRSRSVLTLCHSCAAWCASDLRWDGGRVPPSLFFIPAPRREAAGASRPHAYSLTAVKRELAATYAKRPCISLWWASEQTPTTLLGVQWLFPSIPHEKNTWCQSSWKI